MKLSFLLVHGPLCIFLIVWPKARAAFASPLRRHSLGKPLSTVPLTPQTMLNVSGHPSSTPSSKQTPFINKLS